MIDGLRFFITPPLLDEHMGTSLSQKIFLIESCLCLLPSELHCGGSLSDRKFGSSRELHLLGCLFNSSKGDDDTPAQHQNQSHDEYDLHLIQPSLGMNTKRRTVG